MIATSIIAGVTFLLLTLSVVFVPTVRIKNIKIGPYWIVALLGAIVLLVTRLAPIEAVGKSFISDSAVNPLKILVLFFSMTFLSVYLDEVGLFKYLAKKAVDVAGNSQYSLFAIFYFLTALLTIFTSNDVVVLTLTPFICFFCKNTKINPIPFLVGEFAAANTYSMALIIGNPTNIFLATSANIGFVDYFKVMALPTLAAGIVEFAVISLIFHKSLRSAPEKQPVSCEIESKIDLVFGGGILGICLIFLVISGYINVQMWLVSAICAAVLLVFAIIRRLSKSKDKRLERSLVRLPWQLIPFVLSMFVIVVALQEQGVTDKICALLGDKYVVFAYGSASFLSANVINNIPMSMLFSALPVSLARADYLRAIYASIVGSNLGAFLTPLGALAGIMFTELTSRYEVKYGFKEFVRYGIITSIPTLAAALIVLFFLV
ncbi:MAG: hypothetical protein IJS93_02530 [Clostridia bacterium]|nr:hypothetical protein [Clostridia bacterium]